MGAPPKLPGFVRWKRPYRITRYPRKSVMLYESTHNEIAKLKQPGETWDDFMARVCGIKKRK